MQEVHAKGVFRRGDFPDDTVNLVAEMAGDPAIRPEPKVDPRSATEQQVAAQQRMAAAFRHPDVCRRRGRAVVARCGRCERCWSRCWRPLPSKWSSPRARRIVRSIPTSRSPPTARCSPARLAPSTTQVRCSALSAKRRGPTPTIRGNSSDASRSSKWGTDHARDAMAQRSDRLTARSASPPRIRG